MNFRLKSWDVFSWTAMRGGLFRPDNDFLALTSMETKMVWPT